MTDNQSVYYDGTKLLSLKDINGRKPEIYISTTNRSAGKTTYFSRNLVNNFLKKGEKFMILHRWAYELQGSAEKFFKVIRKLFFPDFVMDEKIMEKGVYAELTLNGAKCGYVVPLNKAEQVKKLSNYFSDVSTMFMDEFQSETNTYVTNEVTKFLSIYKSVARGEGEQTRYVRVILCGNPVTLLNPYYIEMGIANRINTETKFLRGDGFVLEQGYNESADLAQQNSGVMRAFNQNAYVNYSGQGVYLNDNTAFIEKPRGFGKYMCTLKYDGKNYAVRQYLEAGIVYCDDSADMTFPIKITVKTEDHDINYVMLRTHDMTISLLRYYFEKGCFRFKDIQCKDALLSCLSY